KDVTIACYGLAFKADIDDLRESPALAITQRISAEHPGPVLAVEPNIEDIPSKLDGKLNLASSKKAQTEADVIVLLVDHKEFKELLPIDKPKIDTRGIW